MNERFGSFFRGEISSQRSVTKMCNAKNVLQRYVCSYLPDLPDFSLHNIPKWGKIYQIATTLPNGHKIYQMAVVYSKWPQKYQPFPFQGLPMFTQIGIFGLKTFHLATLLGTTVWGGEGVSGTSYASPPPCPSIFSNYSLIVHHPVNRDDRHLLAHAMASNFTVAWQYSVLLLVWAAGGTALPQILRYGLAFRWTPDYFQREQSIFCYGLNSTP
jgi:hypothetical protein